MGGAKLERSVSSCTVVVCGLARAARRAALKKRAHARMEPDASHAGRCQRRHLRGEADPSWRVVGDEEEAAAVVSAVAAAKRVEPPNSRIAMNAGDRKKQCARARRATRTPQERIEGESQHLQKREGGRKQTGLCSDVNGERKNEWGSRTTPLYGNGQPQRETLGVGGMTRSQPDGAGGGGGMRGGQRKK